ncbi:MAG TPA: cyclic peptide export ABC transporter [Bryobacteraceae bacterium]|nr:cyclic peptide export ABC transporter [Bryobacteraceae bacterium]HPU72366.1 cyclic peptide export ABC transporter [Bryobacteraceae bacterium]
MGILEFLQQETHALDRKLLVMTAASGTANAAILAVINASVDVIGKTGPDWRHFSLFGIALALFVYSLRYVLYESTRISEEAIRRVRVRLADKVRRADLFSLESIGEADIHARINRETSVIVQSARPLFAAAQSAVMVLFTMLYVAAVSPIAVILCGAMIAGGVAVYLKDRRAVEEGLQDASRREDELFTALNGVLRGFKELRINRLKSDDVFEEFGAAAARVRDVRTRVMLRFSDSMVFVEAFFQALVGAIVFILPVLSGTFSASIVKIVAAVLFMIGPLSAVVMMIPVVSQVEVAVANIRRLEARLDEILAGSASGEEEEIAGLDRFEEIRLEGVAFSYRSPDGSVDFRLGPVDAVVKRGEILFLVGGNGSGKTTFLKLLTALYVPEQGVISVDSTAVTPRNVQSYRHLFSAIFSDFHLFDRLYGLREIDPARVEQLLELMQISGKTTFRDGRFSTISLSTGQRKRLALVISYLEDKPVYVFDEVAADQDPQFRAHFYEVLLPELKKAGKTVIVISHDDRYFHVADRVLRMEYGKIGAPEPPAKPARKRRARRGAAKPDEETVLQ